MERWQIDGEMFLDVWDEIFYDIFHTLEGEHALDPLNETDIYCLHYTFVPRINRPEQTCCG